MDVGAALVAVPRERFLPAGQRRYAAKDAPLPIGHEVTNSQPSTVRAMLELLAPEPGDRVLDVGCGSGWTTALLAHLVGPHGQVVGVEIVPEVLAFGAANLGVVPDELVARTPEMRPERPVRPTIELHLAELGVLGWPAGAPYDRILVSADAPDLPADLIAQLVPGGRLVGPVRGEMLRVTREAALERPRIERHGRYLFVPLRTLER
ncbi:fibrillarin-like rRNA methylase [Nocardioides ginsengisoli]|uniref:Protein-L-isoaspartate O-methyltransferase n=1 Tax=Nocardioides ginsengisoli TaxID=363868 RepID=A0ABW3VYL3_9ACTN